MQSFTLGGEQFKYTVQSGKVIKIDDRSETHISSSTNNAGYVQTVGSTVLNHQNFFMEGKDGKQFVVSLTNWNIRAMENHELTFVWLGNNRMQNHAMIYNKSLDFVTRNGFFHEYFKVTDDNIGCLKLIGGAIALIGIPTITYGASRSEAATFMTFLIMLAFFILIFVMHGRQKDRQQKNGKALAEKMEKIFNENK